MVTAGIVSPLQSLESRLTFHCIAEHSTAARQDHGRADTPGLGSVNEQDGEKKMFREGTALSTLVAPFVSYDPNSGGTPTSILRPRIVRLAARFRF